MITGTYAEQAYVAVDVAFAYERIRDEPHPNIVNVLAICKGEEVTSVLLERLGPSLMTALILSEEPIYIYIFCGL